MLVAQCQSAVHFCRFCVSLAVLGLLDGTGFSLVDGAAVG